MLTNRLELQGRASLSRTKNQAIRIKIRVEFVGWKSESISLQRTDLKQHCQNLHAPKSGFMDSLFPAHSSAQHCRQYEITSIQSAILQKTAIGLVGRIEALNLALFLILHTCSRASMAKSCKAQNFAWWSVLALTMQLNSSNERSQQMLPEDIPPAIIYVLCSQDLQERA